MNFDRTQIPTCSSTEISSISQIEAAYEEEQLGQGIRSQLNNAIQQFDGQLNKIQKSFKKSLEDIEYAENEIKQLELALDRMLFENDASDKSADRKIRSLESQLEVKITLLETFKKRKICCENKLEEIKMNKTSGILPEIVPPNKKNSSDNFKSKKMVSNSSMKRSSDYYIRKPIKSQKTLDDSELKNFKSRVRLHQLAKLRDQQLSIEHNEPVDAKLDDHVLTGGLRVPGEIWNKLYAYQQVGVSWLWKLHQHGTGGILGDEMGLGKTIQIIAFLSALRYSRLSDSTGSFEVTLSLMSDHQKSHHEQSLIGLGPVLIVCPGTVLNHWFSEFRKWIPTARVVILHSSGTGYCDPAKLISAVMLTSGMLLTTYTTLLLNRDLLLPLAWHYIVLDEGHKIKNPDSEITTTIKRFSTPHKLIVSGTPMQNNLKELWSIFDFVCPGKLSSLPDFLQNFAVPIVQGGYANSTPIQVETAYRCACALRSLLTPFLLRRMKSELSIDLPNKSEQVLFCRLTKYQRSVYEEYLDSKCCADILSGKGLVFKGLILLKALCNHPDLVTGGPKHFGTRYGEDQDDILSGKIRVNIDNCLDSWDSFGCARRSGKLVVALDLLKIWHNQGHKVLVFTQSRRMLKLLEKHVSNLKYSYLKMDGTTPVGRRQDLVDMFNQNTIHCFVFLLTTRVGGIGVNLTGANRVLIYDPDWNPSTDAQARERAWRIGQIRDVSVFRLLSSGTIEEKIYQRQIFKQFLTNRVLKNPRQQRFFKLNNLQELFSLNDNLTDDKVDANDPDTLVFLKKSGSLSSMSTKSSSYFGNRFDQILSKTSLTSTDSEIDKASPEELVDASERAAETEEHRKIRLRQLAQRLSRKLVETSNSGVKLKPKRRLKRKCGTCVDGKRIYLVDRRSDFDDGLPSSKRSKDSMTDKTCTMDPFVMSIMTHGCEINSSLDVKNQQHLQNIERKRSLVDEQTKQEALRVAEMALRGIRASKIPLESKISSEKHQLKPKSASRLANHKTIKTNNAHRSVALNNIKLLNHDVLMNNFLMASESVDPSLTKLEIERLANNAIEYLYSRAQRSILSVAHISTDVIPNYLQPRFGVLKNYFLWNPQEKQNFNNTSLTCQQNENMNMDSLFTGHNRLSSHSLIEVIKRRLKTDSSSIAFINSPTSKSPTKPLDGCELDVYQLALNLLNIFKSTDSMDNLTTTTAQLVSRFHHLLSATQNHGLTAGHLRALLRLIATLSNRSKRHRIREQDVWILKPKFVMIARRLALNADVFNL